jgi:hypothetical protein
MGTDARIPPKGFYPCIRFAQHPLKTFPFSYATPVERTEGAFRRLVEGLGSLKE